LNAPATSSATLTWNANSESDLAGYKVYRATSSGAYGAPLATLQGNVTSYVSTGLQSGTTYFFVITAYDNAGNESAFSTEVSKSIF
jgi:fibronectin type 3 domain-containing protein